MTTKHPSRFLTTTDAAIELKCSRCRVLQLLRTGRLRGLKHGRDWIIVPRDLDAVRVRINGRPRTRTRSRA